MTRPSKRLMQLPTTGSHLNLMKMTASFRRFPMRMIWNFRMEILSGIFPSISDFMRVGMNDHSNFFCSGNIYQNYRYRWNVDSIPPVFLCYDIFRNIATTNFYFSFTAFSAVFGVPVSPLPSLPKVQGFRQILQAVYCLRSSDWMLFSHCVIQPSYCRPVFPAPLSLF